MRDSPAYAEVNRKWKATVKVLLGVEAGDLAEYRDWISRRESPRKTLRSSKSGKDVIFAAEDYLEDAPVLAFDEVDFSRPYPPLSINDLKDIDSLLAAVRERASFSGNILLGNSKFCEASTNVVDSFYLYDCERNTRSKYVAHSAQTVHSECIFGTDGCGYCSFCIRVSGPLYIQRGIEVSKSDHCSDVYFVHGLEGCHDCMFCFNMTNASHAIGNLKLPPSKYLPLKAKLVAEMGQMLFKDKKLPTLFEFVSRAPPEYQPMKKAMAAYPWKSSSEPDPAVISRAFSETCGVVLGKPHSGLSKFEKWLLLHTRKSQPARSCASGKPLVLPEHVNFLLMPKDRLVGEEEAHFLAERLAISIDEADGLSMRNAPGALSKVAYFSPDWNVGECRNNSTCQVSVNTTDSHRLILPINTKQSGCGFWVRDSEHIFGANEVRWSEFCMKCYRCEKIKRCFECDSCWDCSDCLYCHDCENVHDSMFCFNVKNKRNAVGNVELPRGKYLETKKKVLSWLNDELSRTSQVSLSIFGLGGK